MENGRQALEAFEQRFYPFLLTDWVMPEMDGLELCRAIRAKRDQGYVYVILLTHKGSKDDIIVGLEAGADDYLTKPVYFVELTARINKDTVNDQKDWVVRYGGEEFLLVLPDTTISGARELSEMLREFVAQATIKAAGHDINITASFGLAGLENLTDADAVTPEKLLNLADENLYQAKEEGRNRVKG